MADKSPSSSANSETSSLLTAAATLSKGTSGSNINQACSIKLDGTNYLVWQFHVLPIIKGNKLERFLHETKPCPPQFITKKDTTSINPAFEDWVAADQLLFGWLLNTMQPKVFSQMVSVSTAAGLREAAQQHAGAHTKSRVLMLKSEFQRTRKGSMKMAEFLTKLKNIFEQLNLAGSVVSLPDLFIQVLAGLDADYNPIVVQLGKEVDDLSWIEFQSSLLTYENRMEQLSQLSQMSIKDNFSNYAKTEQSYPRNPKNSSAFLKAATTTLLHKISESEKASYVIHINNYLAEDEFLKRHPPMDPSTDDLFEIAKDGILLCKLVNVAVSGTIEERAINTKSVLNPWERNENHTLCLNSAKAIGCTVVNIGTQDFIEGRRHLVLGLISQIIKIQLLANLDLKKTPQLLELADDSKVERDIFDMIDDEDIMQYFQGMKNRRMLL